MKWQYIGCEIVSHVKPINVEAFLGQTFVSNIAISDKYIRFNFCFECWMECSRKQQIVSSYISVFFSFFAVRGIIDAAGGISFV